MDKNELAESLRYLSHIAAQVAKQLDNWPTDSVDNEMKFHTPNNTVELTPHQQKDWPEAGIPKTPLLAASEVRQEIKHSFDGLKILEYSSGYSGILSQAFAAKADVITSNYKFAELQPVNCCIINDFPHQPRYDLVIFNESLESSDEPLALIQAAKASLKSGGRIFIRFRPWTSIDGGFQSHYYNYAYAQLVRDLSTPVRWRVAKPLMEYHKLLAITKLSQLNQVIRTKSPADFFLDPTILDVIIARTWGSLPKDEAIKILTTKAIDCLLLT